MGATFPVSKAFMHRVASGVEMHFMKLKSKGDRKTLPEDHSLGARLARRGLDMLAYATGIDKQVQWQDLLGCCEEKEELDFVEEFGHFVAYVLESVLAIMPDEYMFKERLVEMYVLRKYLSVRFLRMAARFFSACFVYTGLRSWAVLIATVLNVRVFLCFASYIPVLGRFMYPICYLAEKLMDWDQDHWLLGCVALDESGVSWISSIPVWLSRHVGMALLTRPEPLGACIAAAAVACSMRAGWVAFIVGVALGAGVGFLLEYASLGAASYALRLTFGRYHRFLLAFVIDFFFTAFLCRFHRDVLQAANDIVQPKLVLMSVKLGSSAMSLKAGSVARRAACGRGAGSAHSTASSSGCQRGGVS